MKVPFLDLSSSYKELQPKIEDEVLRSLRSGWYVGGADVETFENDYATFTQSNFCVGVANGLDALQLALKALGVQPGDEVIVPSNTFIATWLAVSDCGAIPVPVEPDALTCNIDCNLIESAITKRTKVIIPVHLYGQPADMDAIVEIARRYGLRVLEDAAQAQGASYKGRPIGSHGDIVAWSFYPGKNLGAVGDAGAITTNDSDLADKVRVLRNYGSRQRYVNEVQGYNSRLDPVQASVLKVKLNYLREWNSRRAQVANRYTAAFSGTRLVLPVVPVWADPVWHLYCVRHSRRDELRQALADRGVETLVHYPIPPHLQAAYASFGFCKGAFPLAESMADSLISLPIGPAMTEEQIQYVISSVLTSVTELTDE
jgi:dTDP-4-amino-4,6-dideoxygalactose transaminase